MSLPFEIGARVVHTKTGGRVRGEVVELRVTADRVVARVVVDGMRGRDFDYDVTNLEAESTVETLADLNAEKGG